MPVMYFFYTILLQKNVAMEVLLNTRIGEYRAAVLSLLIILIIASLGCIFLYLKLNSLASEHVELVILKGKFQAYKELTTTSEVAKMNLKDQLLAVYKDMAAEEKDRSKKWKERADKLEEERDHCRNELLEVKEEKAKEVECLKYSKRLQVIKTDKKCESSSSS